MPSPLLPAPSPPSVSPPARARGAARRTLSGRVPKVDVQRFFDALFVAHAHRVAVEREGVGGARAGAELVEEESLHELGLADGRVAQQDDLQVGRRDALGVVLCPLEGFGLVLAAASACASAATVPGDVIPPPSLRRARAPADTQPRSSPAPPRSSVALRGRAAARPARHVLRNARSAPVGPARAHERSAPPAAYLPFCCAGAGGAGARAEIPARRPAHPFRILMVRGRRCGVRAAGGSAGARRGRGRGFRWWV
jgi:hypothetical protein